MEYCLSLPTSEHTLLTTLSHFIASIQDDLSMLLASGPLRHGKGRKEVRNEDGSIIKVQTSESPKILKSSCPRCGKSNCKAPGNCDGLGKKKKITTSDSSVPPLHKPSTKRYSRMNIYNK